MRTRPNSLGVLIIILFAFVPATFHLILFVKSLVINLPYEISWDIPAVFFVSTVVLSVAGHYSLEKDKGLTVFITFFLTELLTAFFLVMDIKHQLALFGILVGISFIAIFLIGIFTWLLKKARGRDLMRKLSR